MPLTAGDKLGPYEIISLIGKGGMGEVYRARDTRLNRDVAIKVSSERFSERFEREARVIASLNHPNICTLHDVGPNYLVMELVDGPTLAERIKEGAIPLTESLNVGEQMADALEAAHEKGITHRDLKPGNVKIKPDGTVKVLDFGLAKTGGSPAIQSDNSPTLTIGQTEVGMILGTAAYMAPEQAKGKPVDKRADIWAFGVVMYEMVTGQRLFSGDTTTEVLAAVIEREPTWDRVPPKVQRLLRMCLEKDPHKRLRHIANVMALVDDEAPSPAIAPSQLLGRRWLWPAVAGVAVLVLGGALVLWTSSRKPPSTQEVRLQIPVPEKLTFNFGTAATISPDGRWVAFPATGSDNVSRMWIRALDSPEVKGLEGTEVSPLSSPPFWSSDSRFLAFGDTGAKLKKVEISGGPPQSICDATQGAVNGGAWDKDGVVVFGNFNGALTRCSAAGSGSASPVTVLAPGETAHRWPQFLPDGHHFLYFRAAGSAEKTGIFVGSIDAKPEQQSTKPLLVTDRQGYYVASESDNSGWLLFVREGTLMAERFDPGRLELSGEPAPLGGPVGAFPNANYALFSVSTTGVLVYRGGGGGQFQLTWFDPQGNRTGVIGEPSVYQNPTVSPDGARVAVAQNSPGNQDIWMLDAGTTTRLTFDPARDDFPVWSPDGRRIVFASNRGGHFDLYQKASDGTGEDQLLFKSDENKRPESWSHDGRYLLYRVTAPKTGDDLWVLPLEGDRKPFPFLRTEFREIQGQFSPDMRWVAYTSTESGGQEVYVRPFAPTAGGESASSGGKWMISKDGGLFPHWRADGKQLYFLTSAGTVMVVDVTADKTFQAIGRRRLFDSGVPTGNGGYAMPSDGKRFLFVAPQGSGAAPAPFMVVMNWQARLKK